MSHVLIYTAVFTLSMAGGQTLETSDSEKYESYDACMVQAEADAKNMALDWERAKRAGVDPLFRNVSVRCEPMEAEDEMAR